MKSTSLQVVAFGSALVLGSACSGAGGGPAAPTPTPTPEPSRIRLVDPPELLLERVPATFTVEVVDGEGRPASYDGTISIESSVPEFSSPAEFAISGTSASVDFMHALGGDLNLVFSSANLTTSASHLAYVQGERPVWVEGAETGGAVLAEGVGWDSDGAWGPSAVLVGAEYWLWYASSNTGGFANIGLAKSSDGVAWTRFGAAPVVGPSVTADTCHSAGASNPDVFRTDDAFVMLYRGETDGRLHLCRAVSADGETWTPMAGLEEDGSVLATSTTEFDNRTLEGATVVRLDDGTWRAIYAARGDVDVTANNPGTERVGGIGLASSADGEVWTKVAGPNQFGSLNFGFEEATSGDTWDAYEIGVSSLIRDGNAFRMWLSGLSTGGMRIGYHVSFDLGSWFGHVDNFETTYHEVVSPGAPGAFDDGGVERPSVIVGPDGVRRVYYTGLRASDSVRRIGLATFPQ